MSKLGEVELLRVGYSPMMGGYFITKEALQHCFQKMKEQQMKGEEVLVKVGEKTIGKVKEVKMEGNKLIAIFETKEDWIVEGVKLSMEVKKEEKELRKTIIRYQNDPLFHGLVDKFRSLLINKTFSVSDIEDALLIARKEEEKRRKEC